MKFLFVLLTSAQLIFFVQKTNAQALNFDNSPLNYQNSPLNYENSPLNPNSTNGVYDNRGKRIGYEVQAPNGVTNYFDNKGNRIGYSPSNKVQQS